VNSHYKPNCSFAAGLNRREFNGLCAALGSSLHAFGAVISTASAIAATTGSDSNDRGRTVKFHDGTIVPALGQGSAQLAQGRHPEAVEEEALRTGLSLGMTLVDTAEVYGNGRSEELIGHVIAGKRDRVFLVSKVWPSHVTGNGIARACEASLTRLGTDHRSLPAALAEWGHRPLRRCGGVRKSARGWEDSPPSGDAKDSADITGHHHGHQAAHCWEHWPG
jgi:hypothetical protein